MYDFGSVLFATILTSVFIKYLPRVIEYVRFRRLVSKLPCVPGAYPLVGHVYGIDPTSPIEVFEWISRMGIYAIREGEKMCLQWLGPVPMLTVCHPDSVEKILGNTINLDKGSTYKAVQPWLKTGLLTSARKKWGVRRKLLTPSFHFSVLDGFLDVMNEEGVKMTEIIDEKLKLNETVNMENTLMLCTLDIICRTAMGASVNAQKNTDSEYVEAIRL